MKQADVAVIGGGILGCFAARNLMRWKLSVILLEKEPDVCTGITRANSAIVYAGYDNRPGSRKAAMTVAGNRNFDTLCRELDVPLSRCGSLMVTYDEKSLPRLRQKLENGQANGVPGLQMLSEGQVRQMEPALTPGVAGALYAPSTGTVNPWSLGIAAFENGVRNGVVPMLSTGVTHIKSRAEGYVLQTNRGDIACKAVINCAGLYADQVQEMLFPPDVRLHWDGADYLVLDRSAAKPGHIIFEQAEACGKGITLIPCVEGNLLLSGMRRPAEVPFATTAEGLAALKARAKALLPELSEAQIIRSFGAMRPNPYGNGGESLHDFCILSPGPGFYSLVGIKTPGLTCADELGKYVAEQAAGWLGAAENPNFDPRRKGIPRTEDPEIVCQCQGITRGEIEEAIRRGAVTVDGVKRRVGSGMGPCQGSRCSYAISRLLKEAGYGAD